MSIHPLSGRMNWDIPADAGPSTNIVTVRVTDNAIDSRSATRAFTLVVRARARLVINEIMHTPAVPRTEFVEILNHSAVTPWDLSGSAAPFPTPSRRAPASRRDNTW